MAQQTAISWLIENIPQRFANAFMNECEDVIEQAKQMEKEQIVNAWDKRCRKGTFISGWHIETQDGEQYYNETYKKD